MRREGRVQGKLTDKSRAKGYYRQGKTSRCRLQKSKQKKRGASYKRFAQPTALSEFLHGSPGPVKELHGFLHLVSDIAHDMVGHDVEGAQVQSAILAVTVHSIMEAAFV